MNKNRLVFYGIFIGYHCLVLVFTIFVDRADLNGLIELANYRWLYKFIAFFGVIMVTISFVSIWLDSRKSKKEQDDLRLENNSLKAKVYDLQEKEKNTQPVSRT